MAVEEQQEKVESQEDGQEEAPPAGEGNQTEQTPPWGSDEEFNPEKAWKLIQNLRKEKDELKPLAQRAKELEDSQKSEQQKLQEALEAATAEGSAAKTQAAKLTAALDHGLSKEDLDLLDGVPADQIAERAEKLAARLKTSGAPPASRNQGGDGGDPDINPNQLADRVEKMARGLA